MHQDIDIYSNNISLLGNQMLSPIADEAPTFYKFFITDTIFGLPAIFKRQHDAVSHYPGQV
jgi:hypothetical protein